MHWFVGDGCLWLCECKELWVWVFGCACVKLWVWVCVCGAVGVGVNAWSFGCECVERFGCECVKLWVDLSGGALDVGLWV